MCYERLKPYLDDTDFHMSAGVFPGALQPDSVEVLAALAALKGLGRGNKRNFR